VLARDHAARREESIMATIVPALTFGDISRPELILDSRGEIVLTSDAAAFAATYGLKALHIGLPATTPYPPVQDSLSTPININAGGVTVANGAAMNIAVNLTVSATSAIRAVTYSLIRDSSGGGFTVNSTTGVVAVADPAKIDFRR
jgi:large repetitive protein